MSLIFLLLGIALILAQGICAYFDGYLTQSQLYARGIMNGYSFIEHGGIWADVFIISPSVAYIIGRYKPPYGSIRSMLVLGVASIVIILAGYVYTQMAIYHPEALTHDNYTTPAGWLHGLFALAAAWILALFYLGLTRPPASTRDIMAISVTLTPFCFLSVVKFSNKWEFSTLAQWQVALEIFGLWIVTWIRLRLYRKQSTPNVFHRSDSPSETEC